MVAGVFALFHFVAELEKARVSRDDPHRLLTSGELAAETGLAPAAFWAAAHALRRDGRIAVTIHPAGRIGLTPTGRGRT